jgi:hypothetical protein
VSLGETEGGGPSESAKETGLLAILATLAAHEVEFLLVGGLAVGYHGYPRATKDIDIVPAPDAANLDRLWAALVALGAEMLAVGELRREEVPVQLSAEALRAGANWDLRTTHGRLDVIQVLEGALETPVDYERLRSGAVPGRYSFGTVWVAGYDDLIDLKTLAGREQDLIDIRALREANDDTAPSNGHAGSGRRTAARRGIRRGRSPTHVPLDGRVS